MEDFLRKIKVLDSVSIELETMRDEFARKLNEHVEEDHSLSFPKPFEMFSSSKKTYKGVISYDSFKLKKRKKLFDTNPSFATISGRFFERGEMLQIQIDVNSYTPFIIPFYIFALLFDAGFLVMIFNETENNFSYVLLIILSLHAVIMLGLPFVLLRRSTASMLKEIERELYFISKK